MCEKETEESNRIDVNENILQYQLTFIRLLIVSIQLNFLFSSKFNQTEIFSNSNIGWIHNGSPLIIQIDLIQFNSIRLVSSDDGDGDGGDLMSF